MNQIYNLHTPFVAAYLLFVVIFIVAHAFEGDRGNRGGSTKR